MLEEALGDTCDVSIFVGAQEEPSIEGNRQEDQGTSCFSSPNPFLRDAEKKAPCGRDCRMEGELVSLSQSKFMMGWGCSSVD